jgi:hypothetical protein
MTPANLPPVKPDFRAPVGIERTVRVSSQFASLFLDAEAKLSLEEQCIEVAKLRSFF